MQSAFHRWRSFVNLARTRYNSVGAFLAFVRPTVATVTLSGTFATMAQMESERATLLQACLAVVDRLAVTWGWQLLGRVTWAQQAADLVQAGTVADPPHAAMFVYSQALHSACSGGEGRARQNLAYSELFHYL